MTKTPEELLALEFGGASVAENIERSIETGDVVRNEDGTLERAGKTDEIADENSDKTVGHWKFITHGPPLGCDFLLRFLFFHAYAESAVPYGCRACYKVKVMPRTLRELVAAWNMAKDIACSSKWGIDLDNRFSQNIYAGYYYTSGLDMARAIFKIVRDAMDGDPKLGPDVPMVIKRGCSEYEAKLGPSDRYEFAPELAELEAYLKSRFRRRPVKGKVSQPLVNWIDLAFRIGDDTYLDFTGGKRLRPKMKSYDSDPLTVQPESGSVRTKGS
jgi:hypothetical protein